MFLSIALALAVLTATPDFEPVARTFVNALERNDPGALTQGPILGRVGTAPEILEIHTDISIDSARIVSTETRGENTLLHIELDGTAVSVGTRRRVSWPRWWVVEVARDGDGWRIVQAVLLERKLALDTVMSTDAERDRLLGERKEIDVDRYFMQLANAASTTPDAGATMTWLLRESRARGLIVQEINTLLLQSSAAVDRWDAAGAVPPAEAGLALAQKAGIPEPLADSYFSVGIAYWVADRLPEAVSALERASGYLGQYEDPRLPLRSLYMASHLELRQKNPRRALALASKLEMLVERYPSPRASMDVAFQLASIHRWFGNRETARRNFERARAAARSLRDRYAEALAVYDLSGMDADSNEPYEVMRRIEEALEIGGETLGPEIVAAMRLSLAEVQRDDGDHERAERTFSEVLEAARTSDERSVLASAHSGRSALRLAQGRIEEALADAREGRRYAQGAGATGRTRFGPSLVEALSAEGRALHALGQRDAAATAWRAAVDAMEVGLIDQVADETASAAVGGRLEPYHELLALFVEEGCARDALVIAERMRARTLRDSLRHGRVDLSAGLTEAQRKREQELEVTMAQMNRALFVATDPASVTSLQRERDEARLALREFRTEIYASHPGLASRRAERLEDHDDWVPSVAPGEVVLELAVTSDAVVLFRIEGTTIRMQRIAIAKDVLERQVEAFVTALEQRDFGYRGKARALYDLLLAPARLEQTDATRVRIVPDGPLWRVPFQALVDAGGRHLAERMVVTYSPSLSLSQPVRGGHASRSLLALGDPAIGAAASLSRSMMGDGAFGRLPDAVTEVRSIARLYANPQVGVGEEARESLFKRDAPAFRVLHLAAHSIIDDGAPMFSSIVLAAAGGGATVSETTASETTSSETTPSEATPSEPTEDGLLEAREIADLKLQADLAILSACETARGKITTGEGMVGLSWAFLAAGVPTTVVSQWKVGSASTSSLMIGFHRRLRDGIPAAEALRMAMLDLRKDPRWRHPFYWAPFVVVENVGGG